MWYWEAKTENKKKRILYRKEPKEQRQAQRVGGKAAFEQWLAALSTHSKNRLASRLQPGYSWQPVLRGVGLLSTGMRRADPRIERGLILTTPVTVDEELPDFQGHVPCSRTWDHSSSCQWVRTERTDWLLGGPRQSGLGCYHCHKRLTSITQDQSPLDTDARGRPHEGWSRRTLGTAWLVLCLQTLAHLPDPTPPPPSPSGAGRQGEGGRRRRRRRGRGASPWWWGWRQWRGRSKGGGVGSACWHPCPRAGRWRWPAGTAAAGWTPGAPRAPHTGPVPMPSAAVSPGVPSRWRRWGAAGEGVGRARVSLGSWESKPRSHTPCRAKQSHLTDL